MGWIEALQIDRFNCFGPTLGLMKNGLSLYKLQWILTLLQLYWHWTYFSLTNLHSTGSKFQPSCIGFFPMTIFELIFHLTFSFWWGNASHYWVYLHKASCKRAWEKCTFHGCAVHSRVGKRQRSSCKITSNSCLRWLSMEQEHSFSLFFFSFSNFGVRHSFLSICLVELVKLYLYFSGTFSNLVYRQSILLVVSGFFYF